MLCIKHNWRTDGTTADTTPCPYCRIAELEAELAELKAKNKRLRGENERLVRAWEAIQKRCTQYEKELGLRKSEEGREKERLEVDPIK